MQNNVSYAFSIMQNFMVFIYLICDFKDYLLILNHK